MTNLDGSGTTQTKRPLFRAFFHGEANMDMSQSIFWQEEIEKKYNRKHIDGYIRKAIRECPVLQEKVAQGVQLLEEYRSKTYDYDSKNRRIEQLRNLELGPIVVAVFVGVAYCLKPQLFTSVTSQMAGRLGFSDKREAIQTTAEIVAVLCQTDVFDIIKKSRMASLEVKSRIILNKELIEFIENSAFLPPMVCKPKELENNYSSGYLTHADSLLLGKGNHHDGDLCLDVLNLMNSTPLRLDTEFLSQVEEEPTFSLDTQDQVEMWKAFKKQSYRFYSLVANYGNRFYLTHKVDKRGRIYSSGYHISTQGTGFKKASIELAQ